MEVINQPEAWVEAASAGDSAAFNHLVLAYQDGLYGWVFSLVRDEAMAGDLTQSTLITAFEKLHTFRGGSFRAWLFRIARNRAFDALRLSRRSPSISLDAPLGRMVDAIRIEFLPGDTPPPEQILEQAERTRVVLGLLEDLPEAYQQVVRLVDMEGLDYREAAQVLALPIGTIKSRLTRGRLQLRGLVFRAGI
jgi:RNA polymerase sigma-70 factor (ECF subfamily)